MRDSYKYESLALWKSVSQQLYPLKALAAGHGMIVNSYEYTVWPVPGILVSGSGMK